MDRKFGWKPDIPDIRDVPFKMMMGFVSTELPPYVDLRVMCSEIEDQKNVGSCTANALVGALEYLERKEKSEYKDLSRLFVYYNERVMEDSVKIDQGAMLRTGIKTLVKEGVCPEYMWPYTPDNFAVKPFAECYLAAQNHQILNYQRLETLQEMRACLAEGFPFVFGFAVYESIDSPITKETGTVNLPGQSERMMGGHAVMAVGYDDLKRRLIVRNSWGKGWGDKGYFTLPYEYVENSNLSADFWVIKRTE